MGLAAMSHRILLVELVENPHLAASLGYGVGDPPVETPMVVGAWLSEQTLGSSG